MAPAGSVAVQIGAAASACSLGLGFRIWGLGFRGFGGLGFIIGFRV